MTAPPNERPDRVTDASVEDGPGLQAQKRRELRVYLVGFAASTVLTALPFAVVAEGWATGLLAYGVIAVACLAQVGVHFRCFLHITPARSTRDDLQLNLFTGLIVVLMVGGTLWIMGNLHMRMMSHAAVEWPGRQSA